MNDVPADDGFFDNVLAWGLQIGGNSVEIAALKCGRLLKSNIAADATRLVQAL